MTESLNRAFLYGESVFTTMRMVGDHLCDWDFHFDRLKRGIEFVYGPFHNPDEWVQTLKAELESRLALETGDKVIRLTMFLEQSRGLVRNRVIAVSDLKIHINATPLDPSRLTNEALKLRTCPAPLRPHWWPSYLKPGSYLATILAQKMYLKDGDDDLLFLSSQDTVLESSVANIFVVRHNKLYTAPLGPQVLDGVMRKKVLNVAHDYFAETIEEESTLEQLYKADAVFGANSVRGLFLIGRVDEHDIAVTDEFLPIFERLRDKVYYEKT